MKVSSQELNYRDLSCSYKECLKDCFDSALCILSRGSICGDDYQYLLSGMRKIVDHIYNDKFSSELAIKNAAKVMLISACLYADIDFINLKIVKHDKFVDRTYSKINYLNNLNALKDSYNMAAQAIDIMCEAIQKENGDEEEKNS